MCLTLEQIQAEYKDRTVYQRLVGFAKRHIVYELHHLQTALAQIPDVVNKSRVSRFAKENTCQCVKCGIEGSIVAVYRHNNEPQKVRHVDIFALNDGHFRMMTRDHTLPKSLGGSSRQANLLPMCVNCNHQKSNILNRHEVEAILADVDLHLSGQPKNARLFTSFLQNDHPDLYDEFVGDLYSCALGMPVRPAIVNVMNRFPVLPIARSLLIP